MRIAIDTRDLKVARTGNKTYLEEICRALTAVSTNHQIIPLAPSWDPPVGTTPWHKIAGHLSFYWWKEVELPRLARQHQCDLILCTDYVVPLWTNCKRVPVFHDAAFWERPHEYNKLWRLLLDLFALPAARRSDAIIAVSQASKQRLIQAVGLPPQKLHVIYEAPKTIAHTTVPPEQLAHILAQYRLTPTTPFMLHVGVMEKRKNLVRLVEAFAQAKPQLDASYRLVLVGQPGPKKDMDDSANIAATIAKHQLQDHVLLTGYLPDKHLSAFYQAATFYVFPSLYEGFGLPILEAFANNLPLAAADATSIGEVAADAALLFDPTNVAEIAQALVKMAHDDALRQRLVHQGNQRLQAFSWQKTAQQMFALFEQI